MNTSTTLPSSLNRSTWFQTVALMDARIAADYPVAGKSAPAITGQTFAALRQEASGLRPAATGTSHGNADVPISFDTVRLAASTHFLQRTTKAPA